MNVPYEAGATPYVLADTRGSVCTLTLNRGARFNPLSTLMIAALDAALDAVARETSARVVVLASAGRAFCAGHDLTEMRADIDPTWQRDLFEACARTMLKLTQIPQPVIARIHGAAAAAGRQLVSMCDLAVAADHAKFGLSGINAGIFCSTPVGVARNVSRKRAFYAQVERPIADAYALASETMACNMLDPDTAEGVDAFLGKRPPQWRS
jgi:enoyl-CoA hydratase/carnithine racemase